MKLEELRNRAVKNVARKIRCWNTAEDLFQTVAVKVLAKSPDNLLAYTIDAMIYEYGRECRKFRTRMNIITGYKIVTDDLYTEDAETTIVKEQTCRLLDEAVNSLSHVRKQSLLASINTEHGGLAKTARELGINENTFKRNNLWALKDIRAYLQKRLSTTNLDSLL